LAVESGVYHSKLQVWFGLGYTCCPVFIEIDVLLGLELDADHHSEEGVVDL
jgi:hypothetical protein